ncbi:hypothetical protein KTH_54570 [Thermosporothrix hazakensis]|nr:hypothetical protein KTH_54570 [Thermosporothrix hazakensis]
MEIGCKGASMPDGLIAEGYFSDVIAVTFALCGSILPEGALHELECNQGLKVSMQKAKVCFSRV